MSGHDGPLPCAGQHSIYDLVLHHTPAAGTQAREAARWQAATLCGRCPQPCAQPITPPGTRNAYLGRGQRVVCGTGVTRRTARRGDGRAER